MTHTIAAIDSHKKLLMVVVASAASEVEHAAEEALEFQCRRFGATHSERMHLTAWLQQHGVTEIVIESTAQYWKPVQGSGPGQGSMRRASRWNFGLTLAAVTG